MKEKQLLETAGINIDDWNLTPIRVRDLVVQQGEKIEQLEQRLTELEVSRNNLKEKVNRNSDNSHSPPSSDSFKSETKKRKKRKRRKRGGQTGFSVAIAKQKLICSFAHLSKEILFEF